jgi:hypothetical protein
VLCTLPAWQPFPQGLPGPSSSPQPTRTVCFYLLLINFSLSAFFYRGSLPCSLTRNCPFSFSLSTFIRLLHIIAEPLLSRFCSTLFTTHFFSEE